jgi:hypothetical protein
MKALPTIDRVGIGAMSATIILLVFFLARYTPRTSFRKWGYASRYLVLAFSSSIIAGTLLLPTDPYTVLHGGKLSIEIVECILDAFYWTALIATNLASLYRYKVRT